MNHQGAPVFNGAYMIFTEEFAKNHIVVPESSENSFNADIITDIFISIFGLFSSETIDNTLILVCLISICILFVITLLLL